MPVPRSPIITVSRGRFSPAAAQVMEQVRGARSASRDEIAAASGLSIATVGRTVAQARRVRPPARASRPGPGGRDRPARRTRRGRPHPLRHHRCPRRAPDRHRRARRVSPAASSPPARYDARSAPSPTWSRLSRIAATLLGAVPGRVPLSAGLVAPWREIGLVPSDREAEPARPTGLLVRTGDHISAVAATEFLHRRHGTGGMTLYLYARDTIGWSVAVDRGVQTDVTRAASLTHFPTGSAVRCPCGRTGCIAATLPTLAPAERARTLGALAGSVRDMLSPDRVVLVGQAFTGDPESARRHRRLLRRAHGTGAPGARLVHPLRCGHPGDQRVHRGTRAGAGRPAGSGRRRRRLSAAPRRLTPGSIVLSLGTPASPKGTSVSPAASSYRRVLGALVVALTLVLASACSSAVGEQRSGSGKPQDGGVIRVGAAQDIVPASIFTNSSDAANVLIGNVYDSLVDYPLDSVEPKPRLATSWKFNDDGTQAHPAVRATT
ncbi:hypothetical protein [Nocardioides convexus]|uniref:hypothetical protein n=1 Tax=Nocardioides convexus TaxID=2712224 RepID=UPI0024186AD7|nr:hypothetical protein [Nocardioides convexus]